MGLLGDKGKAKLVEVCFKLSWDEKEKSISTRFLASAVFILSCPYRDSCTPSLSLPLYNAR